MQESQNILIVDDKPENLFALENILSVLDAEVVKAGSANDALIAAIHREFALAIVDVHMPEMDGYELAELLRSQKQTQSLPIIFLSAVFYDDSHVFKGYQAGAIDFITKPFHPRILLGKASAFLELSRQRQAGQRLAQMLQTTNQQLEARVHERTASLEQSNQALRESERKLRRLSGRLMNAQEEERKRIASELHDSIGSSLGAVKFTLEASMASPDLSEEARRATESAVQMVVHTMEEVRRINNNLRPPLLDKLGLISAIERFIEQHRTVYGSIAVRSRIAVREEDIPEALKIVIFRVIQEGFHNLAKYSRASQAHLDLSMQEGTLSLQINDNGIGFDPEAPGSDLVLGTGFGLTSMRERVEFSGGHFAIQACPGSGTRITAVWAPAQARQEQSTAAT